MNPMRTAMLWCLSLLPLSLCAQEQQHLVTLRQQAQAAWEKRDLPAVAAAYGELTKADPSDIVAWHHLGYALHTQGRRDEALVAHRRAAALWDQDHATGAKATFNVACVLAQQGKNGEALEQLELAVERGFRNAGFIEHDQDLASLRGEQRFRALIQKLEAGRKLVAVVVHEGVELLDFAGPAEVFNSAASASGERLYRVVLVAPKPGSIHSLKFAEIVPNHTVADCPKPDVIVIPGGDTDVLERDPGFLAWVQQSAKDATLLSVCTGAFIPAKLGMLDGKEATTHASALRGLQNKYPKVKVRSDIKLADNGAVVTSGGVSSGIEGALHLVKKQCGLEVATRVAKYMEYRWEPESITVGGTEAGK
ncbi:MAG TPA: DJ-1/PfpI family protein [Planctomycetota bacterium]|nr:DJ-1/PfpI family protein [Planctomycetota bacterium]